MMGRRMIAASVVAAAVSVGGVTGALIGIPGLSSASSSGASGATGATGATGESGESPDAEWHFRGPGFGAGKGVLDAAAKALNLSTPALLEKVSDGKTSIADVAKEQNVDVQTVIDAMAAVAKEDISNLVNNPFPVRPPHDGEGPGGRAFGFGWRGPLGASFDTIAKALGVTSDELKSDLRNGQSIADIAKAKGVDVSTIIDTLVTEAQSHLDAAVKDGHLTQDQATKLGSTLKDMITNLVDNALPKDGGHFGGFGRHGGPDGFGRGGGPWPGPDDPASITAPAPAA